MKSFIPTPYPYLILFLSLLSFHLSGQVNNPPSEPILVSPENNTSNVSTGPTLSVTVNDPDGDEVSVTLKGRRKLSSDDDFTIVGLPDTQYYTGEKNGGSPEIFYSQTQWILDNMEEENIVFVTQLGDCVEDGDNDEDEWKYADTAMLTIEDTITTLLEDGIPFAVAVGNHDQSPWGDPNGTTLFYNTYFGESRFSGRAYYGGHFGSNNDNSFQLFSAGGMDFIAIHMEYDLSADPQVLNWADDLLTAYTDRRAILVSHFILSPGNPGFFSPQGAAIYEMAKDNKNAFLMLGGHFPGEGRRTDLYDGNTIHSLLADYQNRSEGGEGWLRIMKFSPVNNTISVKTYSPWLDEWETDADSEFILDYNMEDAGLEEIDLLFNVTSGTTVTANWMNLEPNTEYEWKVLVGDGEQITSGPLWSFTTGNHRLDLKVYLEGPFGDGSMNTVNSENIPLAQPFTGLPWNYPGTENVTDIPPGVVDWVLVEIRDADQASTATSETIVTRFAAFLKEDGTVSDLDGNTLPGFSQEIQEGLFVVIRHRNHLSIMSSEPLINTGGVFEYDFTIEAPKTFGGTDALKSLPGGFWGMVSGDFNADGIIDETDKDQWILQSGQSGFLSSDQDFNGEADNADKNDGWLVNLNREVQLPD